MKKTKQQLVKIIKNMEKSAGYRVCNLCDEVIERGERIVFHKEIKQQLGFYRPVVIGAICQKCFKQFERKF